MASPNIDSDADNIIGRAYSRFAPSQWETALLCNDVSHWLDASLEWALYWDLSRWPLSTEASLSWYICYVTCIAYGSFCLHIGYSSMQYAIHSHVYILYESVDAGVSNKEQLGLWLTAYIEGNCLTFRNYVLENPKCTRKTTRFKSSVGFWLDKSPLSTAKNLIDAEGYMYVCFESVKCYDCMCRTLGDRLTLSLAETLNQDWLTTFSIFVIPSQILASSIRQYNFIYHNQNRPLHCP